MIRSANMATMPQRITTCIKAIESIYNQVDVIRLYLNNFDSIPKEFIDDKIIIKQGQDLKCTGRLWWALNPNEYYFTIDDDIYYPETYVNDVVSKLNLYNDDIIVSLHGSTLKKGILKHYFKSKEKSYHFRKEVLEDVFVDIIGAGVSAFNTNKIILDWHNFKYHYMDDISVCIEAHKQGKKRLVMAHSKDYFKYLEPEGFTLFDKYVNDDSTQTEMVNSIKW